MFQVTKILRHVRGISTTKIIYEQAALVKFKKLQADFQREDGKPIWLKRGFSDRVLYSSTVVLSYLGFLMCVICIYDNAKPQSWKKRIAVQLIVFLLMIFGHGYEIYRKA